MRKGKRSKKRGLSCRDAGIRCTEQCTFGTKKASCKNKVTTATTATNICAGRNAFERHQAAHEETQQQITV